jgi:hypothetical protein
VKAIETLIIKVSREGDAGDSMGQYYETITPASSKKGLFQCYVFLERPAAGHFIHQKTGAEVCTGARPSRFVLARFGYAPLRKTAVLLHAPNIQEYALKSLPSVN